MPLSTSKNLAPAYEIPREHKHLIRRSLPGQDPRKTMIGKGILLSLINPCSSVWLRSISIV